MVRIDTQRRKLVKAGGVVGLGALAGCVSSPDDNNGGSDGNGDETTDGNGGKGSDVNVGMVYATGGLGDNSFNDMAHSGVQQAKQEFGVSYQNSEPDAPSDVENLQRQFAQSGNPDYDLICCIGFVQVNGLLRNAQRFTDQNFMLVDSVAETEGGDLLGNVANYTYKEHQGSFQVGHLAGLLTTTDLQAGAGSTNPGETVVGFVGGEEVPLIKKFEAGYKAGVEHADGNVQVRTAYAGAFNDPVAGKEAALSMYDQGADIVYHAAGGSGDGVFEAAQQEGRFAIGVDSDQSKSAPNFSDVILASMVKYVDLAVYRSVKNVVNGEFKGGEVNSLGLGDDGVQTVYGDEIGGAISDDVKSQIEESRQAIVDGEIDVPTTVN